MRVTITPGPCRFTTIVDAEQTDSGKAGIKIQTDCTFYKPIEEELTEVDAYSEVFGKLGEGEIYSVCRKYCKHAACPVPSGIIKAVEATFKLALPTDVSMVFDK